VIAKPIVAKPKPKVDGIVYILGKEFLVNLVDNRFVKLTVVFVLDHKDTSVVASSEGGVIVSDGFGAMTEEVAVRDVITNDLTDAKVDDLITAKGRADVKEEILKDLKAHTDVKVDDILFIDV